MTERRGLAAAAGPGLIWAATAIGVSHLVQATRAGAGYGWALVPVVLLANLLKYPFFEFGPRYAAATGRSLLEGYAERGRWTLFAFLLLCLGSGFAVVAAVGLFTGSLASLAFGGLGTLGWSAALLAGSALLLGLGRYPALDTAMKAIVVTLTLSTLAAVALAAGVSRPPVPDFTPSPVLDAAGFAFLIALVGWMPSGVELSVFHSLWTLERARQTGHRPSLREALLDFNAGYLATALVALAFLALGALTLYGSGVRFAAAGPAFAAQLIDAYAVALGGWSRPLILFAALTTMLSTTLAVVDGFPRVLARSSVLLWPWLEQRLPGPRLLQAWTLCVISGSLLLMSVFVGQLTRMVDVATSLSFLLAPLFGWLNYRVVTGPGMPVGARPPGWLRGLALAGLAFGALFAAVFGVWRLAR